MSYKASAWAVEVTVGDPIAKLLLLTLAEAADIENHSCWPSRATLAARIEASEDSVDRKMKLLVEKGLVTVTRRKIDGGQNRSNVYALHVGGGPLLAARGAAASGQGGPLLAARGAAELCGTNRSEGTSHSEPVIDSPSASADRQPSPHVEFMALWTAAYERTFGERYIVAGGKDGATVKRLLARSGKTPKDLVAIAELAWSVSKDRKRFFRCGLATSLVGFAGNLNDIILELKQGNAMPRESDGVTSAEVTDGFGLEGDR